MPHSTQHLLRYSNVVLGIFATVVLFSHNASAGSDEGTVIKKRVYTQTTSTGVSTGAAPFHFAATIRDSMSDHTGTVLAPPASTWIPNPFTVVDPAQLFGAHFAFDQGFADQSSMDLAFPEGEYKFNVSRTYTAATTQFSQAVQFTGGAIPFQYPQITNSDWHDGALWVNPSDARISYTTASGVGFSWGIVAGGGSAGGSGSGAPGLLDLTGILAFGQTYTAEFRFGRTESAYAVTDNNAGVNDYQRNSTYSAVKLSVVQFMLKTPTAPSGFSVLEATYTSAGISWDAKSVLESEIRNNSIIYRMDEWRLTNRAPTGQDGSLYVKYENADGVFESTIPYVRNSWNNYLILPNPAHAIVPVAFSNWATKYFSSSELYDLALWGRDQDPDSDGQTNLKEFAFGLNPKLADTVALKNPEATVISDSSGFHYLAISYRKNIAAQVIFTIQQSLDLVSWPTMSGVETVENIIGEPNVKKVTVRASTPIEWLPKQFLRVAITDPNPAPTPPPANTILEAAIGYWSWFNGGTVELRPNGTLGRNGANDGTWKQIGNSLIQLSWYGGLYIDTLTLSKDNNTLSGSNAQGVPVSATRTASN